MEKILTITVPAYNVERFLDQTLASFADERVLDLLEVLIVDDGSKDHTAEITKRYEEKYPQTFRLISKENGGHGSTINRGDGFGHAVQIMCLQTIMRSMIQMENGRRLFIPELRRKQRCPLRALRRRRESPCMHWLSEPRY